MQTELALVTVNAPRRRVDVALPVHVPLADLLAELLSHAGEGLADDGERHGGWVLRRAGGAALDSGQTLQTQGVRDGTVLHLVPARVAWPELEYDDVVEAIADGARRRGAAWSGADTLATALVVAGTVLAAALVVLLRAGPGSAATAVCTAAVAAGLTVAGIVVARVLRQRAAGVALGAFSLPYAFVTGALLTADGGPVGPVPGLRWVGAPELLLGSAGLTLQGVLGIVGVGAGRRVFAAAVLTGLVSAVTAVGGLGLSAVGCAAVLAAGLVCGVGVLPVLAIRLGRLPIPPVTLPAGESTDRPDRDRVFAAVARTEELLGGMLIGHAVLVAAACAVLVGGGGFWGRVLAGVCGAALLLRARVFVTARHRVPLLAGGVAVMAMVGLAVAWRPSGTLPMVVAAVGLVSALVIAAAGVAYRSRPAGPYLGRAADLLDTTLALAVVPVACAVLGLYAHARALID